MLHLIIICVGNHKAILSATQFTDVREYRYYNKKTRGLDYMGMLGDLEVRIYIYNIIMCIIHINMMFHNQESLCKGFHIS